MLYKRPLRSDIIFATVVISVLTLLIIFFTASSYRVFTLKFNWILAIIAVGVTLAIFLGYGVLKIERAEDSTALRLSTWSVLHGADRINVEHIELGWGYSFASAYVDALFEPGTNKIDRWARLSDGQGRVYFIGQRGRFWHEIPADWTFLDRANQSYSNTYYIRSLDAFIKKVESIIEE